MPRLALPVVLLLAVSAAVAAPIVILNGKPANLPVADLEGKAYVDIVALMQLLGGKATYDAAAGKLYINRAASSTSASAANFGTPQLPGDDGRLGQAYKLREGSPLYFRLNSVEYSVAQLQFGNATFTPKANEKLLVLHFSVQNPQATETLLRSDSLKFTAVDAMDVNHEGKVNLGDEQTQGELNIRLKPAQRVEAYVGIVVPAKGIIPKLMVIPPKTNDGPILRYDLHEQVSPLAAPIADPTDPTGATALEVVPAQLHEPYPLRYFDVTVEGFETVTTALDAGAPPNGASYFVVTLSCRHMVPGESMLRFDTFGPTLTDAAGQELKLHGELLAATAARSFSQRIKFDTEATVRYYFTVPKDAKVKTFAIKEATSRTYQYDVPQ